MTDKRKLTQEGHHQSKTKRFKVSSTNKRPGQTKPLGAKNTKHHVTGAIVAGKKGLIAAKWKKKKKYVFKTAKATPASKETYRKIQDIGDAQIRTLDKQNEKDVSIKRKKKKRRKKKPKRLVGDKDKNMNATENGKSLERTTSVAGKSSAPDESAKDSLHKSVKKKKNRKKKGPKARRDGKDQQQEDKNKSDVVLPRKPEDVSANWKAMMSKLQKNDSSKSKKNQEMHKKGKEAHFKDKMLTSKPPDIWFDDVDPELLKANEAGSSDTMATKKNQSESEASRFIIEGQEEGPTKCVALDCEMVGAGREGKDNLLARVSIVNQYGHCLYDKFVKPREDVTDYRTWVSGVRAQDLKNAEDFLTVQKEVADLLKGRILVGHALQNDMKVLFLDHPKKMVRDTFKYEQFRKMFKSRRPGLKGLVEKILNVEFQQGEHSSVEDAQAVMKLYMLHRKNWEASLKMKPIKKKKRAR